MESKVLDDFIDDCFIGRDPICNLYRDDSIWLDQYLSKLIIDTGSLEEGH